MSAIMAFPGFVPVLETMLQGKLGAVLSQDNDTGNKYFTPTLSIQLLHDPTEF